MFDTGCHKTLFNKKVYDANQSLFSNLYKVLFLEKHFVTVGNGQKLVADFMLALPIQIQGHWFEFLVLVIGILDEYDFVLGLETIIQVEATYYLTSHLITIEPQLLPLYPVKNIQVLPKTLTMIQLIGDLPCTIICVKPVNDNFSFVTFETDFINQTTSFLLSNTSDQTLYFPSHIPLAFLDLRSIGYFNPPSAINTLAHELPRHTFVTHFNSLIKSSVDRFLPDTAHAMDVKDPYPWLELNS